MKSDATELRHDALVYDSAEEYVTTAVGFLREGLRDGEGAVVANTRRGIAVMREALGDDAGEVAFVDVGEAYTRPARTLAAYHAVYAEQLARTPSLPCENRNLSNTSPGKNFVSPGSSTFTLRSICERIVSMCLSLIFTPWARYTFCTSFRRY